MFTFIDVHGFAGGFTLGMVQAGFKLLGKREGPDGFGVLNCTSNRHLLGDDWEPEMVKPYQWTPLKADVVAGNPPCSGFSTYSKASFRGIDSPINHCMWDLVRYAAKCNPTVVVFESVQPAFYMGRSLMQALRVELEQLTGKQNTLYHVLHNAASVGGCAVRKRYFFLVTQVPFGLHRPPIKRVPTLFDAIGDLRELKLTWQDQPYDLDPTWWSEKLRNPAGTVDGHTLAYSDSVQRIIDVIREIPWEPGEMLVNAAKKYFEKHNSLPESFKSHSLEKYIRRNWEMGFQPRRWDYHRQARVIMGSGCRNVVHPEKPRTMTFREVARIMGFPDTWTLKQCKVDKHSPAWFGKGIPVQCGEWIGVEIRSALEGKPGSFQGEEIGSRERLIDITNYYKEFPGAYLKVRSDNDEDSM